MSILSPSPPLRELSARQVQWIGAGYFMCLASSPGQTVLIAQFNTALRDTFNLSHGEFGLLYAVATIASSIGLIWAGAFADKIAPRTLGLICLSALAVISASMSQVTHIIALGIVLFGLRFFGQGMMGLIAMTTMSRWFNRYRGRALSFAQLGFPTGEATLPLLLTLAIVALGWRQVWLIIAAVLVLVFIPLIAVLLRDPPDGKKARARGDVNPDSDAMLVPLGGQWTRNAVLKDPLFYMLIPGFMGPPTIITLFIFHQAHLAAIKGWDLMVVTAFFPVLSASTVIMAIVSGGLVDRFGAWRIVPFILIPQGLGCLALGVFDSMWVAPIFFATFGMSMGMLSPIVGALWTEIYGTAHIGAIRSLATAAFVLGSAIGPGLSGGLIDFGVELDFQAYFYGVFCLGFAAIYFAMQPGIRARVDVLNAERIASMPI